MAYAWAVLFVALGLGADGPGDSKVRPQYEALLKACEADVKAWEAKYPPAGKDLDLVARYRDWPGWGYAPRVLALAEADPGDPASVDALIWVLKLRDRVGAHDREIWPHFERAVTLLRDHLKDPRVDAVVYRLMSRGFTPASEEFLRSALENGPDREVRGRACLNLAYCLAMRRRVALDPWFERHKSAFDNYRNGRLDTRFLLHIRTADAAALCDEAAGLYERADREFGDVVLAPAFGVETVGERARDGLRELLTLSVGRVAPEIAGPDDSGERLSLREHRGEVVVLVFSLRGNEGIDAPLRSLLERHKGKPFAVLGVNNDADKAAPRLARAAGEIAWRCWSDGANGPIFSAWNIQSTPTIYVLDADGVIRLQDARADSLDETVDRLLAERKAKP
jgi:hypothetical protein